MKGLKLIRKQCNFSLSGLAKQIGVSRQLISAWENGKKEIPKKRKEQLSEFFGVDLRFLDDISEEDRNELLDKAMFSFKCDGEIAYRYVPEDKNESQMVYFIRERQFTIDEEISINSQRNKDLLDRIQYNIDCPMNVSYHEGLAKGLRARYVLSNILDAYDTCFERATIEKMLYYRILAQISDAVRMSFVAEDEDDRNLDDYSNECTGEFVTALCDIIKRKIKYDIEKEVSTSTVRSEKKTETKVMDNSSFENKIKEAEAAYLEFKKSGIDTKEFHVLI